MSLWSLVNYSSSHQGVSVLQRNMNYGIEQESKASSTAALEEGEVTSTPLAFHDRHAAIRRRATEIEAEEHAFLRNIEATPLDGGRAPTPTQPPRP